MKQEIQTQQVNAGNKLPLIIVASVLLIMLIVGVGVYIWQKSANDTIAKNAEQKSFSMEQRVLVMNNNQTMIQSTSTNQQGTSTNTKTFSIPEVGIKATFLNN